MKKILFSIFALFLFLSLASPVGASITASGLFQLVNKERVNAGLSSLTYNAELQKAAQEKVNDMVEKDYFAHTSPDGREFQWWMDSAGYEYGYAGENIIFTTGGTNQVMLESWMNSPSHRSSILSSNFTESGLAIAIGTYRGEPAVYAVQMFASPKLSNQTGVASKIDSSAPSLNTTTGAPLKKPEVKSPISVAQIPQAPIAPISAVKTTVVKNIFKTPIHEVKTEVLFESKGGPSVTINSESKDQTSPISPVKEETPTKLEKFLIFISRLFVNMAQAFS